MTQENKLEWLDWLRGLGIFLVVLGHISYVNPMNEYRIGAIIYSFHMPLLFFVSAFGTGYCGKYETDARFLLKKIVGQGIPYLIFSVLYIFMNATLNKYVSTNTIVEYRDILSIPIRPIAQYWFLWALLFYSTITPTLVSKYKYKWQEIISVIISLLLSIMILMMPEKNSVYYKVLAMWFVYICGFVLGKRWKQSGNMTKWTKYILFIMYIVCTYLIYIEQNSILRDGLIVSCLHIVIWISCVAFWSIILEFISRFRILCSINNFLSLLGKNSIYIFIFHSYFLSFSRIFIRKLGIKSIGMEFVIAMSLGIGGSLFIGFISKRNRYLDFCFYPVKYLP